MHHTRRRVGVGVVVVGLKLLECFRYGLDENRRLEHVLFKGFEDGAVE